METFIQKPHQPEQATLTNLTKSKAGSVGMIPGGPVLLQLQRLIGNQALQRLLVTKSDRIQRVVEVRPPGRGSASAFERRQELLDRLNRQSTAIQYRLDGRVLRYNVVNEAALTSFDHQMQGFIDRAEVVPMRLVTSADRVRGQKVDVDYLDDAQVDLDDMLACEDLSFQLNLIHILAERFRVRNFERRIGMNNISDAEFNTAHQAAINAETAHLRNVVGDPDLRSVYEETRPNGTLVFGYSNLHRNLRERYYIFHVFRGFEHRNVVGGEVWVQTGDHRRLTIEQFRAERAAGVPPVPAAP